MSAARTTNSGDGGGGVDLNAVAMCPGREIDGRLFICQCLYSSQVMGKMHLGTESLDLQSS